MNTSIIFPLPLPAHIVFGIIGVVFFTARYFAKKELHYLLLAMSVASTFLIYICSSGISRRILSIEELVLYILVLIFMFRASKKAKAIEKQTAAEVTTDDNSNS